MLGSLCSGDIHEIRRIFAEFFPVVLSDHHVFLVLMSVTCGKRDTLAAGPNSEEPPLRCDWRNIMGDHGLQQDISPSPLCMIVDGAQKMEHVQRRGDSPSQTEFCWGLCWGLWLVIFNYINASIYACFNQKSFFHCFNRFLMS